MVNITIAPHPGLACFTHTFSPPDAGPPHTRKTPDSSKPPSSPAVESQVSKHMFVIIIFIVAFPCHYSESSIDFNLSNFR